MAYLRMPECAAVAMALAAVTMPAAAQAWQEYAYADAHFAVQLPAPPAVEAGTYTAAGGIAVPATIYALRQPNIHFTMTVADLTKTPADKANAIDEAVRALRDGGEIKVDVRAEINGQYGRELTVAEKDGSRAIFAIFLIDHRLYELKAKVLPPTPERRSGDAIRFQQSLRFINVRR
jgi:hypothetical protein